MANQTLVAEHDRQLTSTQALRRSPSAGCPSTASSRNCRNGQLWTTSLFSFADSQLEGLYQASLGCRVCWYAWVYCGVNLIGWSTLLFKLVQAPRAMQELRPPYILTALCNLLPSLAVVSLFPLGPSLFQSHWRLINFAVSTLQISSWNCLRLLLLWMQLWKVGEPSAGLQESPVPFQGTSFSVENFYFSCMCIRVLAFPSGQAPDIFLTSFGFLLTLVGNPGLCNSPQWHAVPARVSFSDDRLSVIRTTSSAMWALLGVPGGPQGSDAVFHTSAPLSCPAVLAFWEVAGWWLAILLVFAREVVSRRAFLKANSSRLGNDGARRALLWPLGNVAMAQKCFCTGLFICFMPCLLWGAALLAFN